MVRATRCWSRKPSGAPFGGDVYGFIAVISPIAAGILADGSALLRMAAASSG
ncbi:MAG: hypothetical protein ACJ786_04470 [Catenulispora sp.]